MIQNFVAVRFSCRCTCSGSYLMVFLFSSSLQHPKFIEATASSRPFFVVPLVQRSSSEDEVLMGPPMTPPQESRDEPDHEPHTKRARIQTPSPIFDTGASASQSSMTAVQLDFDASTLLGSNTSAPVDSIVPNVKKRKVAFQDNCEEKPACHVGDVARTRQAPLIYPGSIKTESQSRRVEHGCICS